MACHCVFYEWNNSCLGHNVLFRMRRFHRSVDDIVYHDISVKRLVNFSHMQSITDEQQQLVEIVREYQYIILIRKGQRLYSPRFAALKQM